MTVQSKGNGMSYEVLPTKDKSFTLIDRILNKA
jgi:hypothetical protein